MIDYLEALLTEEEEQEETIRLGQRRTVDRRRTRAREEEEISKGRPAETGEPEAEERASSIPGQEGSRRPAGKTRADVLAALVEEGEDGPLSAGGVPAAGAGKLYEALSRTARIARLAEGSRETVTVTLPGERAVFPQGDWTALDRAAERDARRYDGSFPLY